MTDTNHLNHLAPSASEAAAATERLASWVIGALTAIVIGAIAPVGPAFLPWTRGAMAKAVSTTYCAPLSLAISWRRFFESFLAASRRYRRRSQ